MNNKQCSKCKLVKPINEFHKQKIQKDGYRPSCKSCRSKASPQQSERAELVKQGLIRCVECKAIKRFDMFHKQNGGKIGYRSTCKKCRSGNIEIYNRHNENLSPNTQRCAQCGIIKLDQDFHKGKAKCKQCRAQNQQQRYDTEEFKETQKRYRQSEKGRANQARFRKTDKARLIRKRYENSEKGKQLRRKTRLDYLARKANAKGSYTIEEWEHLCHLHGYKCLACRKKFPLDKLTVDHIQPLSKGGSNFIANIQPLCKPCNSRKRDRNTDYR